MAFNPFRAFRKRQKTFLAVMAIVCMLLFVAGDVISGRKGGMFGSGRSRDDRLVTKLYGEKVYENKLRLLREQHRAASQFMVRAASSGLEKLAQKTAEIRKNPKLDGESTKSFLALQEQQRRLFSTLVRYSFQLNAPTSQQGVSQFIQQLMFQAQLFFGYQPRQNDVFQAIEDAIRANSVDEILDFMVWRHQADQMGIYLTDAGIQEAIKSLTADQADVKQVEKDVLSGGRDQEVAPTRALLYEGLGDDFRVRLAKSTLIGIPQEPVGPFDLTSKSDLKETASLVTPDEFWDFYKQVRTTREIGILGFPVKNYLDAVKDKPTDKELEQLFKRFKEVEYTPTSPRPGFKELRRVRLEWVGARPDTPEYKRFADEFVLACVASAPVNRWPAVALAYDLDKNYEEGVKSNRIPRYDRLPFQLPTEVYQFTGSTYEPMDSLYVSANEPTNLAGVVASAAQGLPWSALMTYKAAPVAREIQKRTTIAGDFVLLGANPLNLGLVVSMAHQKPKSLTLPDVGTEAVKVLKKTIAQDMVINNLTNLKKDIDAKRTKNENIADWLKKSLPDYHVTSHAVMPKPRSRYEMVDDPELKPLKDIYLRLNGSSLSGPRSDPKGEHFPDSFFSEEPKYEAKEWPSDAAGGSHTTWVSEEEPYVYWKVEDDKAYVPTFEAARAKVEKAWRFREARKLARQEADKAAELARATKGDVQKLRDLAAKEKANFLELHAVARLLQSPSAQPDLKYKYEDFKFPESISMPKESRPGEKGFLTELVELKDPGDTVLEGNEPEDIFYVSTLISKQEPSIAAFYDAYRNAKSEAGRDVLLESWMQNQRQKLRFDITNQLRAEACPDFSNGAYNLDPDIRKRLQGRSDDSGE
ncbi:MAG: hypothetical protein ACJ8FY_15690 [Gemmataceae bacterium]